LGEFGQERPMSSGFNCVRQSSPISALKNCQFEKNHLFLIANFVNELHDLLEKNTKFIELFLNV